jgi:hypothetical protein
LESLFGSRILGKGPFLEKGGERHADFPIIPNKLSIIACEPEETT